MRTNYVLIDYENVQPSALSVLEKEHFKVIVFVGASQAKVAFDVAAQLQRLGPSASYVKISGNGPNALDFHIAYYIGHLAAAEPDAYFHIISRDTGFDPLIAHLKTKKIFACRSKDIGDMPIVGFYPETTDGCERVENFKSCLAVLRRILGLWNRSMYSNTSALAASSVGYFVR